MRRRAQRGFTLIELMVAVAILAVLAAVAIPQYTRYAWRARTTEAYTMLNMAKNQQFAWFALNDCFANTTLHPAGPPGPAPMTYTAVATVIGNACSGAPVSMMDLGIVPTQRNIFFMYECAARVPQALGGGAHNFTCSARSDIDGDAAQAEFLYCTDLDNTGFGLAAPTTGAACAFPYETVRVSTALF